MGNRLTKGIARVGSIAVETSGGLMFDAGRATYKLRALTFADAGSTVEQDTGFDLPTNGIVRDVFLKITTASSAGGTIHVGLLASESGGDADGFLTSVGTSSTGTFRGEITATATGDARFMITGSKRGAFLAVWSSGTTAVTIPGLGYEKAHVLTSIAARSVSWTSNSSAASTGLIAGTIFVEYTEIA